MENIVKKQKFILFLILSLFTITSLSAQYQKADNNDLEVYFRIFGEGEPLLIIGGGPGDGIDFSLLAAGDDDTCTI